MGSPPRTASSTPDSPVLRALAVKVRRLREGRGWTRAVLSERSGLSVRFLARIEAGEGNISLLRLGSLAEALDLQPEELIRPEPSRAAIVTLVGLRGAGKSTVGPLLASRLGVAFLEMDGLIQEVSGLPLDQIFEMHGERYYRRLERETLGRIVTGGRAAVVAAAGGVVNEPSSWSLLLSAATVVWLQARPEDHWNRVVAQGDRRPMADNPDAMAELRAMLAAREALYAQAHLTVTTTHLSPGAVVEAIERRLAAMGVSLDPP